MNDDSMSYVQPIRVSHSHSHNTNATTSSSRLASFNELPLNPRELELLESQDDSVIMLPMVDSEEDQNTHGVSDLQDVPVSTLSSEYESSNDDGSNGKHYNNCDDAPSWAEESESQSIPVHHDEAGCSLPSAFELRRMKRKKAMGPTKSMLQRMRARPLPVTLPRPRTRCIAVTAAIALVFIILLLSILALASSLRRGSTATPTVGQIANFLTSHGISSLEDADLNDSTSPYVQAMQWLDVPLPKLQSSNHAMVSSADYERFVTRYVLALLYFTLKGSNWWQKLEFLTSKSVCEWQQVEQTTSTLGVTCDDQNRLVELNLHANDIKGEIPTEIGSLTWLRHIDFGANLLDGTLPTSMCSLSKLTSLDIGENQLRGSLPTCMGRWTSLEQLDIHQNDFTGSLPGSMGTMTQLKRLFLSSNVITGDPMTIWNNMTQLELLLADSNTFTAELNDSFLKHHTSLTWLDLSNNDFMLLGRTDKASTIPVHLFLTTHLQVLDLSKNRLTGSIPWGLGKKNTDLKYLSLYDNMLHGGLDHLTNLVGLRHLDVSRNALTGQLPSGLTNLTHLRLLFLGENHFSSSPIPLDLARIDHLHDLSMRKTNRTGLFDPKSLPSSLVYLDMGSNLLTGVVPETIGQLSHLEFLMLNDNAGLNGALPTAFASLQKLRAAFLDGTGINGNVAEVCKLPSFQKSNGHEIVFADCAEGYDDDGPALFTCECCECCEHSNATDAHGCSISFQQNLRHAWSIDFQTLHVEFTNETVFLNREYIPPFTK